MELKELEEKYKCRTCGIEVMVIKSGTGDLVCCGKPMDKIVEIIYINKKQLLIVRSTALALALLSAYTIVRIPESTYALRFMGYCTILLLIVCGALIYSLRTKK